MAKNDILGFSALNFFIYLIILIAGEFGNAVATDVDLLNETNANTTIDRILTPGETLVNNMNNTGIGEGLNKEMMEPGVTKAGIWDLIEGVINVAKGIRTMISIVVGSLIPSIFLWHIFVTPYTGLTALMGQVFLLMWQFTILAAWIRFIAYNRLKQAEN